MRSGRALVLAGFVTFGLLLAPPGALGITSGKHAVATGSEDAVPHHHPRFTVDESALRPGIAVFARAALDYLS